MIKIYINKFLHLFEVMRKKTSSKIIYLTFDDGPDPGITNFIIGELNKYNYKATFFCLGKNAEKYPNLIHMIRKEGHRIGNHTYSHLNSFKTSSIEYLEDVNKADVILKTNLFRPPWGCLTIHSFLSLWRNYKVIYWSLSSGDSKLEKFNLDKEFTRIQKCTKKGDIVLFHFCKLHESETKRILPKYLEWLQVEGYISHPL